LRQTIKGKEAELKDIERQQKNMTNQIAGTDDKGVRDLYQAKIMELGKDKAQLEQELANDQKELKAAETSLESFAQWKRDFDSLQEALASGDVEIRLRMRARQTACCSSGLGRTSWGRNPAQLSRIKRSTSS
jgi:hypothetical protein